MKGLIHPHPRLGGCLYEWYPVEGGQVPDLQEVNTAGREVKLGTNQHHGNLTYTTYIRSI